MMVSLSPYLRIFETNDSIFDEISPFPKIWSGVAAYLDV
jgi:hypothetical protein